MKRKVALKGPPTQSRDSNINQYIFKELWPKRNAQRERSHRLISSSVAPVDELLMFLIVLKLQKQSNKTTKQHEGERAQFYPQIKTWLFCKSWARLKNSKRDIIFLRPHKGTIIEVWNDQTSKSLNLQSRFIIPLGDERYLEKPCTMEISDGN